MTAIADNYLDVQQDIPETFVDRGQLRKLAEPTVLVNGKRVPGLKLDPPRQLALRHALVRFANLVPGGMFTTKSLPPYVADALGSTVTDYPLAAVRYDLSKWRAKGLVEKAPRTRKYRLRAQGYSICLVFLKLFERIYAPLTAGLLQPVRSDANLQQRKQTQRDRLYQRVSDDSNSMSVSHSSACPRLSSLAAASESIRPSCWLNVGSLSWQFLL